MAVWGTAAPSLGRGLERTVLTVTSRRNPQNSTTSSKQHRQGYSSSCTSLTRPVSLCGEG